MTFEELSTFIHSKMRMSHIYQPVMLMTLIKNSGFSSVTDISKSLLDHEPSQTEYYEDITKNMVGEVLTNHKIVEKIKNGRTISGYKLKDFETFTTEQKTELIQLCKQKICERCTLCRYSYCICYIYAILVRSSDRVYQFLWQRL